MVNPTNPPVGMFYLHLGVSKNNGNLQIIPCLNRGFPLFSTSIIVVYPYFWKHPKPWKMKVLNPQYMGEITVITPKNVGNVGSPWWMFYFHLFTPLRRSWSSVPRMKSSFPLCWTRCWEILFGVFFLVEKNGLESLEGLEDEWLESLEITKFWYGRYGRWSEANLQGKYVPSVNLQGSIRTRFQTVRGGLFFGGGSEQV